MSTLSRFQTFLNSTFFNVLNFFQKFFINGAIYSTYIQISRWIYWT